MWVGQLVMFLFALGNILSAVITLVSFRHCFIWEWLMFLGCALHIVHGYYLLVFFHMEAHNLFEIIHSTVGLRCLFLFSKVVFAHKANDPLDGAHPLPNFRLREVMTSSRPSGAQDDAIKEASSRAPADLLKGLVHFTTPSLPHLIALLCHTTPAFPPQNTSLIVIDSLSALIASAYPRTLDNTMAPRKPGTGKWFQSLKVYLPKLC